MFWTEEQVNVLESMLLEEKSSGKIAKKLQISRNAVLGKIHREPKLREIAARRYQPKLVKPGRAPKSQLMKPIGNTDFKALPASRDDRATVGVPFVRLGRGMCWWAVNEAQVGQLHLFCGAPTEAGARYCPHHTALSLKPPQVRTKK